MNKGKKLQVHILIDATENLSAKQVDMYADNLKTCGLNAHQH